MYPPDIERLNALIQEESKLTDQLLAEMARSIIGQQHMMERLLIGLLCQGHVLLEGLPGLAKTLAVKTLALTVNAKFNRIQFTPDLLPSDIIGTLVYHPATHDFLVKKGPLFANLILADEINRAPAKVQSALLEAMQEKQVTIGDETFALPDPFLVLATQNPIDQEGTYPLPEAQADRFMFKVTVHYPTREDEATIIRRHISIDEPSSPVPIIEPEAILSLRHIVKQVYLDPRIEAYILDIVIASRQPTQFGLNILKPLIHYGASPRAGINLAVAAKALAFLRKRAFVLPEDIINLCPDVLRHRIGLTYEAEADEITTDEIIQQIIHNIKVP
jgi:MoxR-like ATPase